MTSVIVVVVVRLNGVCVWRVEGLERGTKDFQREMRVFQFHFFQREQATQPFHSGSQSKSVMGSPHPPHQTPLDNDMDHEA